MTDTPNTASVYDISSVTIEDEMKRSYLDYAMSVIVSRALPDVRDGLKPVHRRILYAMKENGYDSTKPYKKSARVVGDVMGKYHPHGDQAIYDAMVRMAQDFSLRLPLIDGQGNFGSMDGDPAAAMRYTEARLAKAAETLLDDIDKETVNFQPNYDESVSEPVVLPSRFPNLLVNGAGGIAVGMATNIPPHNLGEVIDACVAYIDNTSVTIEELMELVPGPDFPTGGLILGKSGIRSAYTTGRGSVVMRARTHIEEIRQGREAIIVTEIPYQVNKSRMIERIAEVVREKTVEGIGDLRDESDRDGVRVVIELKRDAVADVVLAQLYRFTPLQTSFGVNTLALNGGRPQMMNLREIIEAFVEFREEVVTRRTTYELRKARERAHILAGLLVAITNLDPVIELIRKAPDPATAREQLMGQAWEAGDVADFIRLIDDPGHEVIDGKYKLSEAQARAILELRLQRLTGMERDRLTAETEELAAKIKGYLEILQNRTRRWEVMREELIVVRDQFANPRRTTLEEAEFEHDIEDLIQKEDMVVTVTHGGYIKRVPLSTYRAQRRGGKGRSGMSTKEDDFVVRVFVTNTHTPVLFFSNKGMVYQLKVYRLPLGNPQARGKAMVNLLPLDEDEYITTVMPLPEDEETWGDLHVMFATATGNVRRNLLSDFTNIKSNGKIAMKLDEGDHLVNVRTCTEDDDVLLATGQSMAIRFPVPDVRVFAGRNSTGVRGIRLAPEDTVISMTILRHSDHTADERRDYIQAANAKRRLAVEDSERSAEDLARDQEKVALLDDPKYAEMAELEETIITVSDRGMGQLCSTYDYRVTGRGGKGIGNMDLRNQGETVAASFIIEPELDELMLVTNGGQIIRMPVAGIRQVSRNSKGVRLFNVADGQRVVSVAKLRDESSDEDEDGEEGVQDDGANGEANGEGENGE
ncbi:DNA gyrase subunit A [Aestuariispira ectoiniformans]|uniref:DNA gyrase subunit A n=1 Tax=Aestuariispira ectoiniformans TaxID=2775080 RepID=UPI00223C471D|nr:DNA gyrase subunit A [Aestuariispira ectoiniformans]